MFSGLRRLLGLIKVTESGDQIRISGLPGNVVSRDIATMWGSNKIAVNMFTHMDDSNVSFNRFFAPDIVYAFQKIIAEKRRGSHVRALRRVVDALYEHTWLKETQTNHPDILDFSQLNRLNVELRDHQKLFLKIYNDAVPRFKLKGYLVGAGPGTGKAQPLNASIKVPGGWARMSDMRVGTEVITPKGTTTTVTGVFPQGSVDIYRITFADGRITEACGDHLWKVHVRHEKGPDYWKIKTTKEILTSTSFLVGRAYIPLVDPEDHPNVDLPIDPYVLGVILGDGNISQRAVIISNPDDFIKNKIASRLGEGIVIGKKQAEIEYSLTGEYTAGQPRTNSLLEKLSDLGLIGTQSHTKFIPENYLFGSKQQRLDLLNGLLDTDGTTDKGGSASYLSTSLDLAENVQYLVRSLGGIASISIKRKSFTYLGEKKIGRVAYQVNIRHKRPEELFTLPKKLDRVSNDNQYCEKLKLRIDKIELIGQFPAQCISVADEEHLYVTNDFVVTHNTIIGLSLGVTLRADVVVCVVPKNAVYRVWQDTIKERFKKLPSFWTSLDGTAPPRKCEIYIVHYDYLEKFVEFIRHSSFHKPLILLDESHNLNELESFRVQKFIELTRVLNCKHVVWESGTPVKALGGELAPLLTTIDDMFTHDAQQRFSAIYGKASSRANDILAARMGRMTYKVNSADVVTGKPIHHRKDVVMPTGHLYTLEAIRLEMRKFITERVAYYQKNMRAYERVYEDILKFFERTLTTREQKVALKTYRSYIQLIRKHYDPVALKSQALFCNHYEKTVIMPVLPKKMKDDFKNVRSIVKYYMLKVQGEALGQVLGRKRSQCNVEMIPHVGMEDLIDGALKKTVIFTSYVNVVDSCAAHLRRQGYKPILVYGKTNNELASMVAQFEKDPDANPLIATYASLSSAVPLVMANQMIMLNSPFRSYEYDQATARCFRMGQDSQVYITDVFLDTGKDPNISTRSRDILDWSRQQVEEILDFKSPNFALEEILEKVDGLQTIGQAMAEPLWLAWANSHGPNHIPDPQEPEVVWDIVEDEEEV